MDKDRKTINGMFAPNVNFRDGCLVVEEAGKVQEIITTSDTKQFFTQTVNQFFMNENPAADRQWEQIYRVMPGTGHGELFPFRPPDSTTTVTGTDFNTARDETTSGSHGIVFNEVGEGGEIRFSRVLSAEKYVKHIKYATAIGYSNEWFSDGQMALVEMTTEDFRDAADDKLAAIHYGAIVASVDAGLSSSTDCDTGTSEVAQTINALNTITSAMRRNKRRPSIVLCAPEHEQIVRLALTRAADDGQGARVIQNEFTQRLTPIVSEYIAAGTTQAAGSTGYVIEPKRRLVSTNRLPLSLGNFSDLLHDAEVLVGKFRRGVLVGEGAVIHAIDQLSHSVNSASDF